MCNEFIFLVPGRRRSRARLVRHKAAAPVCKISLAEKNYPEVHGHSKINIFRHGAGAPKQDATQERLHQDELSGSVSIRK